MANYYLDCFQNNLEYVLNKNNLQYTKIIKPNVALDLKNITLKRDFWTENFSENNLTVQKVNTVDFSKFRRTIMALRDGEFAVVKTNIMDIPWSISSGEEDDVHWVTIANKKVQDPYYSKYNMPLELDALFSNVLSKVGQTYTMYIIKKSNGEYMSKTSNTSMQSMKIDKQSFAKHVFEVVNTNYHMDPQSSEAYYGELLNIANARMQLYEYWSEDNRNVIFKDIAFNAYQEWIALANIYFKLVLKMYDWPEVDTRLKQKIETIAEVEYKLNEYIYDLYY